jgi:hypothetical protein
MLGMKLNNVLPLNKGRKYNKTDEESKQSYKEGDRRREREREKERKKVCKNV